MKTRKLVLIIFLLSFFFLANIQNPDKPLKGEWDFKLKKIWEIDRAGDDVFGRPFSLMATEDGILYVYDTANKINYIFDKDGNFIRAFAKSGQGPGEIIGQEFTHYVNGKVYIPAMNGINLFTKDGVYIQTVKQEGRPLDPRIFLSNDEIISAPKTAVFLPEGKGKIIRKNIKTGDEAVISEFSVQDWGMAHSRGRVIDMISIGFSPLMTLGYSEGRLYWGMSSSYKINVTDLSGKKISSFSLKRKSKKVSNRFKKKYFKSPNFPDEMLAQIADSFPDRLTFFHRIEVHKGLVYVFVPDVDLESKSAKIKQIDIFSPDGKFLYCAYIKFEKNRHHLFSPLNNLVIKNKHLYAVLMDEDDNVLIAKYKLSLPNGN
ncbi:MAG: hypothetical protein JSV96_01435 [Candidatus Aminicenantes bacterium]|nr:MAG: hypothetical protein JSV96_01435 [Candidatus Aminicenantes bacterium]